MIDITELTSVQKNANIHRLSRLIAYAPNDELRQMAVEVEQYTDQLIEALEKAQQRIGELESKLANPVQLPKTNGYWTETEKAYEEAITFAKRKIRLAGFRCEGDE